MDDQEKPDRRGFLKTAGASALASLLPPVAFAQAQVKWRHGLVQAKGDAGFFYMALEKGFFRKRGLDVEFIDLRGDKEIIRALLAGELDSAEPNGGATLLAIDRSAPLRFIGSTMPGNPYALYVRKDITSWAQLKGKTFGVTAPGAAPDIIARDMLARNGVDPDSINIVNAGGSGARIQALAAGKIDATASSTQFIPDADRLGIRVMALAADLLPEYPRFLIIAQEKTLKAKREEMINFLAAYMEGLDYSAKHREETLQLAGRLNQKPANDRQLVYIYDEVIAKGYLSVKSEIPRAKLDWLQKEFLKLGLIREKIDLDKFIDESYRKEALKHVSF